MRNLDLEDERSPCDDTASDPWLHERSKLLGHIEVCSYGNPRHNYAESTRLPNRYAIHFLLSASSPFFPFKEKEKIERSTTRNAEIEENTKIEKSVYEETVFYLLYSCCHLYIGWPLSGRP